MISKKSMTFFSVGETIKFCLILWLLFAATGQVQAGPIYSLTSPNPFRNGSWSFGEAFIVGPQNLTVTALGAFDALGDGFVTPGGIPVGIFRESDASLLVSTNVTSSDPLVAHYRYAGISPLTLLSGVQYRVVAVNRDDLYNISTLFTVSPLVTSTGYGYVDSTALAFGSTFVGTERIWMANFDATAESTAVPEPSSIAMLGIGAFGFMLARRRRLQSKAVR